jgi:large repetitive protein
VDNVAPVISNCPSNITVNANASCQATATWTAPIFTDNCTGGTITSNKTPGSTFPKGATTVTYTATDASGNTATCSFTVTVVDNTAPVIANCPSNITVNANASCEALVTWTVPTLTDNCSGGTLTSNKTPGSTFPKGPTTVLYTAIDAAGNTATCSFIVTVKDDEDPVIRNCPADITVHTEASIPAVVTWTAPTFSDNCVGGTLTSNKSPGNVFVEGITPVTYTATDAAGNTAICSFNVTVIADIPLVLSGCPGDIIVPTNGCSTQVNWTAPTATGGVVAMNSSHNPGDTFEGTTLVTYTATDNSGHIATCSFNVIVRNSTPPLIINCPQNIQADANENGLGVVNWSEPTASSGCGPVTLTSSKGQGEFSIGTTTVDYTATDDGGNISHCLFDVTVTKPDIDIEISKTITPDGDGINDYWELKNLESFARNKVVIFDRWGSVVFEGTGYDNVNVVWRGTNPTGGSLPTGTYFYNLDVTFGSAKFEKNGFIELVR